MFADFHTHTTYSDGTLSFDELVEAAERHSYDTLAITDHVRPGVDHREVASHVAEEVRRLSRQTPMQLFPGVEVTEYEPALIDSIAHESRDAGARVVVAHGECLVADVEVAPGTNAAAVRSPFVDILGHPGRLAEDDARAAAATGVFIELSASPGACYANGHLYSLAQRTGAATVVNSDAHAEDALLTPRKVAAVLLGTGAPESYVETVRDAMTRKLLQRILTGTREAAAVVR
jgi:histidinol phosphatase-like PHP family hydrolase